MMNEIERTATEKKFISGVWDKTNKLRAEKMRRKIRLIERIALAAAPVLCLLITIAVMSFDLTVYAPCGAIFIICYYAQSRYERNEYYGNNLTGSD